MKYFFWLAILSTNISCFKYEIETIQYEKALTREIENQTPIRIYDKNPWYWEYRGKPVLLLGGSYEDNMFQFPNGYYNHSDEDLSLSVSEFQTLEEHLDKLVEVGGNYLRGSLSTRKHGNRHAWKKIVGSPGDNYNNKDVYDLDQWDDEYWNKLKRFLDACLEREIIVQLELFDRFDIGKAQADQGSNVNLAFATGNKSPGWEDHPFNPDRNINWTEETSGLPTEENRPAMWSHPFWYCVPTLDGNTLQPSQMEGGGVVLDALHAWMDKVLDLTFQYDNLLYIIHNEFDWPGFQFGEYWMNYIKDQAAAESKTVYVSDMPNQWLWDHEDQVSVRRSADFMFYEFAQNSRMDGDLHYNQIIWSRNDIADPGTETDIKPINFVKIYGADRYYDFPNGVRHAKEKFWRCIFAGGAAARFHRPQYQDPDYPGEYYFGLGLGVHAQTMIKAARMMQDKINIFNCEPDNFLLSNRSANEAFCLAEKGEQYAVYFPANGSVNLDISNAEGVLELSWLDIENNSWSLPTTVSGTSVTLTTPGDSHFVAILINK